MKGNESAGYIGLPNITTLGSYLVLPNPSKSGNVGQCMRESLLILVCSPVENVRLILLTCFNRDNTLVGWTNIFASALSIS